MRAEHREERLVLPGESWTGDLHDAIAETQAPVKQTCLGSAAAPVVDRSARAWAALAQLSDSAPPVAMSAIATCSHANGAVARDRDRPQDHALCRDSRRRTGPAAPKSRLPPVWSSAARRNGQLGHDHIPIRERRAPADVYA